MVISFKQWDSGYSAPSNLIVPKKEGLYASCKVRAESPSILSNMKLQPTILLSS